MLAKASLPGISHSKTGNVEEFVSHKKVFFSY